MGSLEWIYNGIMDGLRAARHVYWAIISRASKSTRVYRRGLCLIGYKMCIEWSPWWMVLNNAQLHYQR